MTKPTLIQSLLNRPSQTYHFPPKKEYHSSKLDFIRVVNEEPRSSAFSDVRDSPTTRPMSASASDACHRPSSVSSYCSLPSHHSEPSASQSSSMRIQSTEPEHSSSRSPSRHLIRSISPSSRSVRSPASQIHHSIITSPEPSRPSPSTSGTNLPSTTPRHSKPPPAQDQPLNGHESDVESDDDVFYTPRSSLYSSPRGSRASSAMLIDPKALATALLPLPLLSKQPTPAVQSDVPQSDSPVSLTPSDISIASSSSTSSSSDLGDARSILSSTSRATTSTRITSPLNSDSGALKRSSPPEEFETITISSSSHSKAHPYVTSSNEDAQETSRTRPRPLSATVSQRRRRSQTEIRRLTYTDEDWAKDVRWLAPAIDATTSSSPCKPSKSLPSSSSINQDSPSRVYGRTPASYPPPAKSTERRQRTSNRRSRGSRTSRGRMSALLEEDESEYSDVTPGGSSAEPSRAPSPVQESNEEDHTQGHERTRSTTPSPPSPLRSLAHSRTASTPSTSFPNGSLNSKIMSSEEAVDDDGDSEDLVTPDARVEAYARSNGTHRRSYSYTRPLSRSNSLTPSANTHQTDATAIAKTLPTHSLPTPFPVSTPSTDQANGYTGLTLPHAGYTSTGKAGLGNGKVDLARAGLAQTSMATIEVVRGVAVHAQSTSATSPSKKRRTFSFSFKIVESIVSKTSKAKGKGKEGRTPAHLMDGLPLPVAFTAHLPPPSYVPASHVLVQVFAVGLDPLDSLLVQDKIGAGAGKSGKGTGYIPGRSVVGKVVECGWEVKGDVCRKGEWIIALLDARKSGALAEFIVVERHRVYRAPQPRSRPTSLFPSANRRSHARSLSLPAHLQALPSHANVHVAALTPLSIEELSLLPLCALPAHRAVRTFNDVIAPMRTGSSRRLASQESTARALVLQGHNGTGAIAVQILARRGVKVCAQVPDSAVRTNDDDQGIIDNDETLLTIRRNPEKQREGPRKKTRFERVEAQLRAWGADEICVGNPLEVMAHLVEDARSFDAVLDTVGGPDIWEMAQKLLLADPEFDGTVTTLASPSESPRSPGSSSLSRSNTTLSFANSPSSSPKSGRNGIKGISQGQFTTVVGDNPNRPIPTAHDNLRSGFRSVRRNMSSGSPSSRSTSPSKASSTLPSSPSQDSVATTFSLRSTFGKSDTHNKTKGKKRTVAYALVNVAADVDFEGEDVRDSLGAVVGMVEEGWIRPWIGDDDDDDDDDDRDGRGKVVPFERTPEVFRRDATGPVGLLKDGGTCVVKIVG